MSEWVVTVSDDFPNVREMKPLIRCEDCKYQISVHYDDDNSNYLMCGWWQEQTDPRGFCYMAERREP